MQSWLVSVLLHSIAVSTAMVVAAEFTVVPRERVFQWNVSLVTAPWPEPVTADVPSMAPPMNESQEPPPLLSARPDSDAPSPTAAMLRPQLPPDAHENPTSPHRVKPARDGLQSHPLPTSPDSSLHPIDPSKTARLDSSISSDLAELRPDEQPAPSPVSPMDASALPPPDVEPLDEKPVVQEPAVLETARLITCEPPQERPSAVMRSLQADYGWLADTLHAEIERFKEYPYFAKFNRWQGQVVLHVVVQADGQVTDITVAHSSGHAMLDEQAVALLRRISPVPLRHRLKQPRVVLQIPIGYRLE